MRTLGKGSDLATLTVDILRSADAIALTYHAYANSLFLDKAPEIVNASAWLSWLVIFAAIMAILGHSKSIWLNFSGGKSVATGLGVFLMINWSVGLAALGIFALVLAISRIVSLSSISAAVSLPILMLVAQQPWAYVLFGITASIYGGWRHWANIQRLLAGTEPRLGQKKVVFTDAT